MTFPPKAEFRIIGNGPLHGVTGEIVSSRDEDDYTRVILDNQRGIFEIKDAIIELI